MAAGVTGDVALGSIQSLAASDDGQLRLLATDGWSTTQAVAGGVPIPEKGPTVGILSPAPGATQPAGHPLTLMAQALDAEDGFLEGSSVAWRSDRDGELGRGPALAVTDLTVGDHVLTVTATDAGGNAASASVPVTITDTDLPGDDVVATLEDVVFVAADGEDDGGGSGLGLAVGAGPPWRRWPPPWSSDTGGWWVGAAPGGGQGPP